MDGNWNGLIYGSVWGAIDDYLRGWRIMSPQKGKKWEGRHHTRMYESYSFYENIMQQQISCFVILLLFFISFLQKSSCSNITFISPSRQTYWLCADIAFCRYCLFFRVVVVVVSQNFLHTAPQWNFTFFCKKKSRNSSRGQQYLAI